MRALPTGHTERSGPLHATKRTGRLPAFNLRPSAAGVRRSGPPDDGDLPSPHLYWFRPTLRNPRSPVLPRTGLLLLSSSMTRSPRPDRPTMFAKCQSRTWTLGILSTRACYLSVRRLCRATGCASLKSGTLRMSRNKNTSKRTGIIVLGSTRQGPLASQLGTRTLAREPKLLCFAHRGHRWRCSKR